MAQTDTGKLSLHETLIKSMKYINISTNPHLADRTSIGYSKLYLARTDRNYFEVTDKTFVAS